jgi:hypothetical protein
VQLENGPTFQADGTPIGPGDTPGVGAYMWTGHPKITVDDDDLAAAFAAYPDAEDTMTFVYDQDLIDAAVAQALVDRADEIAAVPAGQRAALRTTIRGEARVAERTRQRQESRRAVRQSLRQESRIAARIAARVAARAAGPA